MAFGRAVAHLREACETRWIAQLAYRRFLQVVGVCFTQSERPIDGLIINTDERDWGGERQCDDERKADEIRRKWNKLATYLKYTAIYFRGVTNCCWRENSGYPFCFKLYFFF